MSVREKYGLPRRSPIVVQAALGVAIDAILTIAIIFGGVFWALSGRDHEVGAWTEPPSTHSH